MIDLELAAMAAYEAYAGGVADRGGTVPPTWANASPEDRADWRAVADAVQLIVAPLIAAAQRETDAKLAEQHGAVCGVADIWHGSEYLGGKTRRFADLLRERPGA